MSSKTLLEIARCPEVDQYFMTETNHPCAKIIHSQTVNSATDFQAPEPWSGRIKTAPILFISSNPSIGYDEIYPTGSWEDEDIVDFFQNRFSEGKQPWILDGTKSLRKDGSYGRATMFWAGVKARARELLEREPVPGVDYALTELVHFKSRLEMGVPESLDKCVSLYLNKVLAASGARILIGLGSLARTVLVREFSLSSNKNMFGPLVVSGRMCMIAFLPHPNAHQVRSFSKVYGPEDLQMIRDYFNSTREY